MCLPGSPVSCRTGDLTPPASSKASYGPTSWPPAGSAGIKLMLVNARMSDRSFRHWQRVPGFARRILGGFTRIQARGDQDAERLRALGAPHVESLGDLKFAAPPLPVDQAELDRLRNAARAAVPSGWPPARTRARKPLIAAAHRQSPQTHPGLVTIIAPRHPDRGPALAAELGARVARAGQDPPPERTLDRRHDGRTGSVVSACPDCLCRAQPDRARRRPESAGTGSAWDVRSPLGPIPAISPTMWRCCARRAALSRSPMQRAAQFVCAMLDDPDAAQAGGHAAPASAATPTCPLGRPTRCCRCCQPVGGQRAYAGFSADRLRCPISDVRPLPAHARTQGHARLP